MNLEETLALYKQGKEAWNAWAKDMLDKRDGSPEWENAARAKFGSRTFEEEADFSGFKFPFDVHFTEAHFKQSVHFDEAEFEGRALFSRSVFEGVRVGFVRATFKGDVEFENAQFNIQAGQQQNLFPWGWKQASFQGTTFKGRVDFTDTNFHGITYFSKARFEDEAVFDKVTFDKLAVFHTSTFDGETRFAGADFKDHADFRAIQSMSAFGLDDLDDVLQDRDCGVAKFSTVPDFQQATFVGAPRLDTAKIEPQHTRNISFAAVKTFFKGDLEKEGRWRSLKRLATQGHDHASEQLFFREELLARRGVTDRYWHASFWLGVFYQIFSDFGRSLIRPLLWWATGTLVFAAIYVGYHPSGGEWFLLECVKGTSKPWVAALALSLHRSLPALSGFGDTLPQFQACLYGVQSENPFRPIIPDGVSFLGVPQVLFSAVMIFLFLLAVRNHFRIK